MVWLLQSWEHLLDELISGDKLLVGQVWKTIVSTQKDAEFFFAKKVLNSDWVSRQHWMRYSHHKYTIRLAFS